MSTRSPSVAALAAIFVAALLIGTGLADVVHLRNGEAIRGRIVSERARGLVVEVPAGGRVFVPIETVKSITRESDGDRLIEEGYDLLRLKQLDAARQRFEQALADGRIDATLPLARTWLASGESALEQGELNHASSAFRGLSQVLRDAPSGALKLRDLEQIQADAARGRASVVAKRAEARALAGAARASLEQGDLERALSALSRAETIDQNLAPQLAEPAGALAARVALEYAQAGRFVEAVAFFERCRSRAPELEPDIRDALATCRVHVSLELLLQGHEERAFRTLRLVRSEAPDHALGRYYLGALAELDRDHATAEAHYRRALTALEVRAPDARTAADLRGALERAINHLPITLETLASQRRFDEVLARLPERARSESFVVYANGADLARSVLAAAERSARAVDAWSKRPSPKEPVQVYVFDRETTLQNLPGNSLHVRGVTQVFGRRGVLVRRILTAADVAGLEDEVMPHEVAHALVGSDPDYALPLWLNEGVSMLEERDGALAARIRRYATSRKQGEGLPIAQIVRLPGYPESSSAATSFYDGSAALAAHLMDEHGRAAVLDAFRSDERSLEERLRLFRLAPETAEQAVLRWVQSRR